MRRAARLAALALLLVLLGAGSVHAEEGELGDTLWPPEDHRQPEKLHDLLADALATDDPPLRFGDGEPRSFRIERENATASTARLEPGDDEAGNRTIPLRHRPAPLKGDMEITFTSAQLPITTDVSLEDYGRLETPAGARLRAPPDAFGLDSETSPRQRARDIADRLGLPQPDEGSAVENVSWRRNSLAPSIDPFASEEACVEDEASNCTGRARFNVDCSRCFRLERRTYPTPTDQLLGAAPEGFSIAAPIANRAEFVFDGEARLVAVTVYLHAHLDIARFLEPAQARAEVVEALADRGYEPDGQAPGGQLRFHTPRVALDGGSYQWFSHVRPMANASHPNGSYDAWVDQDPLDGRILDVNVTPADRETHDDDGSPDSSSNAGEDARSTPARAPSVSAAALVLAAWVRRRGAKG